MTDYEETFNALQFGIGKCLAEYSAGVNEGFAMVVVGALTFAAAVPFTFISSSNAPLLAMYLNVFAILAALSGIVRSRWARYMWRTKGVRMVKVQDELVTRYIGEVMYGSDVLGGGDLPPD